MMPRGYFVAAGVTVAVSALVAFGSRNTSTGGTSTVEQAVSSISIDTVLEKIAQDKKVVFVDARERPEYVESHIPGALDLPLRDIDEATPAAIGAPDLVIAYCIKDFRGYEVARRLQEVGVPNVHIMRPYGLNGWKDHGLPLTTEGSTSERLALDRLQRCARQQEECKGKRS
jgi:rhodanese-related sulfurtransferase